MGYVRAVSQSGQASPSFRRGPRIRLWRRPLGDAWRSLQAARARLLSQPLDVQRLSAPAWGAIAVSASFISVTLWWLTQDRSIPIYDVGDQLETAFEYHRMLQAGSLFGPLDHAGVYPILAHMVGAIAMFIGGVNVAAATVGENLVFVPLLALGCYQIGRLLFGSFAGLLAVVFVLGSPLLMSMFHVFLLDAPLAALVAIAVWLILASEDFSRVGVAGAAGLAVGLGMNIKVQFGLFVAGLVVVALIHGGWRNRRGFAIFCAIALVVGTPWYIVHLSELPRMFELASSGPGTPKANVPPTLSIDNLTWYFWNVLNSQLLAPLFVFVLVGVLWMLATTVRGRGEQPARRLELLAGGFAAWLAITLTPHHDIRYGLALLVFLAVIGTGWIAFLPRTPRLIASVLLAIGVTANTLGLDFGVGGEVKVALARSPPATEQRPDRVVLYSTSGFLASAPSRDGDVPSLLQALYREGVRTVAWSITQSDLPDFSYEGLRPLALMVGLRPVLTKRLEFAPSTHVGTLIHASVTGRRPPTCTRLSDGTGVWVARYDESDGRLALYCPTRRPQFYDLTFSG